MCVGLDEVVEYVVCWGQEGQGWWGVVECYRVCVGGGYGSLQKLVVYLF